MGATKGSMSGLHSSVGLTIGARDEQQDCAIAVPLQRGERIVGELLILADGMGGHAGGQEASRLVVDAVVETFASSVHLDSSTRLTQALDRANQAVGTATKENPELRGMGATLIAVAVDFKARLVNWISVGDSHLYLAQGTELQKLNADHSFAPLLAKQVAAGELTELEAANHEKRNTLMSAIIGRPIPMIDQGEAPLEAGRSLLLASDGLDTLTADAVAHTLRSASSANAAARELLQRVEDERRPEQDNTSVVVFNVSKKLIGAGSSNISRSKNKSGSSKVLLIFIIVASLLLSGGVAGWLIGSSSGSTTNNGASSSEVDDTAFPSTQRDVSAEIDEEARGDSNPDIVENATTEVVEANTLLEEEERASQPVRTAPIRPRPGATQAPAPASASETPDPTPSKAPESQIGPDFLDDGGAPAAAVTSEPPSAERDDGGLSPQQETKDVSGSST